MSNSDPTLFPPVRISATMKDCDADALPLETPRTGALRPLGAVVESLAVPSPAPKPAASKLRVIEAALTIAQSSEVPIACRHSVLCQTCLPYRDPGKDTLFWDRENGFVSLSLAAGRAFHPQRKWVQMGLPFGPKPRQVLCYINTQSILQQRPLVDVEDTLGAFIKVMRYDHCGRNFKTVKEQIARLAAADFRLGVTDGEHSAETHKGTIVQSFNLWAEPVDGQRVFWPRSITLDERYFKSLMNHAVPLNARALAALGHSAMALDIYAWLAQRPPPGQSQGRRRRHVGFPCSTSSAKGSTASGTSAASSSSRSTTSTRSTPPPASSSTTAA